MVQCGDRTSVCIGPGIGPAVGQSSRLMGFTGSTDSNASAVYGEATAPTGTTNGVVGVTQSGDDGATGVFGWAVSSTGGLTTGVWGRSSAPNGRGVVGEGSYGVYGVSTTGNVGVYGYSSNGPAVYGNAGTGSNALAAWFHGKVVVQQLGSGSTPLCYDTFGGGVLSNCSSSLRYKTEVRPFSRGLDIVKQLRPIAFTWKQGGAHDVGLAAEEVEQVDPLLTFRNDKGEIEWVKYNQLSAVFVNAFVEQQAQIQRQQEQITEQRHELAALKALVCRSQPTADVCQ